MTTTTAHQTAMMGPGMRLNLSSPALLTMGTDKKGSAAGDSFSPAALMPSRFLAALDKFIRKNAPSTSVF